LVDKDVGARVGSARCNSASLASGRHQRDQPFPPGRSKYKTL